MKIIIPKSNIEEQAQSIEKLKELVCSLELIALDIESEVGGIVDEAVQINRKAAKLKIVP